MMRQGAFRTSDGSEGLHFSGVMKMRGFLSFNDIGSLSSGDMDPKLNNVSEHQLAAILEYETVSQLKYVAGLLHSKLQVRIVSSSYNRSSASCVDNFPI